MEKCTFVDQRAVPKFHTLREFILNHGDVFHRQGSVVSSWRTYRDHRLGPFFSLRYRVDGRQSAIYLGRSAVLAEQVKGLLQEMQQGRRFARLKRQARAEVRKSKQVWRQALAELGLKLKGFEIRGWSGVQEARSPSDSDPASVAPGPSVGCEVHGIANENS